MINNVSLTGRITKDLIPRSTKNGKTVIGFTLAVDRRFKGQNGERQADFIQVQAWGKTAEILCQYAGKRSLIGVEGRIQTRNYENNQGQRVYVTEVVAENVSFLDSKKDNSQNQQGGYQQSNVYQDNYQQQPFNNDVPFDNGSDGLPF